VVRYNNAGVIFVAKNSSSGFCRHVDIRTHFILDHIEDAFIKIMFVKCCDNDTD
jgi:hypothetical protein